MNDSSTRFLSHGSLMMAAVFAFTTLLTGCIPKGQNGPTAESGPAPVKNFTVVHPEPTGLSLVESLRTEVAKAESLDQKPFVYFTATWCGPCQAIQANMDSRRMVEAFDGTYIIKIDGDQWRDEIIASPYKHNSIPIFYAINDLGEPTGRMLTGAAFTSAKPSGMAPAFQRFFASEAVAGPN